MELNAIQEEVDHWIKSIGVRYFSELTNTAILTEEVGELASLMARTYGEQSFKKPISDIEKKQLITEELADVFFVLVCLANQMDINIEEAFKQSMIKKTKRDIDRHKQNPKLT